MQKVTVMYKHVDGAHFFISGDEKARGLCVAHQNLATAFYAVSPTLNKPFKENHGEDVDFKPEVSLEDLQHWTDTIGKQAMKVPTPETVSMLPWEMAEAA